MLAHLLRRLPHSCRLHCRTLAAATEQAGAERGRWPPPAGPVPVPQLAPQPALVEKFLSEACLSSAESTKLALRHARESAARHPSDCGSTEVQAAVLTRRISFMTEHLQTHPKDHHSRLGLMGMLARRKRLLKYLRASKPDAYGRVLQSLQLKDNLAQRR